MTSLVIFAWVFQVTHDPFWVGVAICCHRLPLSLGATLLARWVETSPVPARVWTDFTRAGLLGLMAGWIAYADYAEISGLHAVLPFLVLSFLRSFFSGADSASESAVVAHLSEGNPSLAASRQQALAALLGASGLIASCVFTIGVLKGSYVFVLAVDLLTFVVSGVLHLAFLNEVRRAPPSNNDSNNLNTTGSSIVLAYPDAIALLLGHTLRMIAVSIALQQWLLLLQVKFRFSGESSGYLYMVVTCAWFLSALFVRRQAVRLSNESFIAGSLLLALSAPLGWQIDSLGALASFTFFYAFVDGALLACIGGEFQRIAKPAHVSRFFSVLAAVTQASVVGGSLLVGGLTSWLGYEQGGWYLSFACSGFLFILMVILVSTKHTGAPLWRTLLFLRKGWAPKGTYKFYSTLAEYLKQPNRTNCFLEHFAVAEAHCSVLVDGVLIRSASIRLKQSSGLKKLEFISSALNRSISELHERIAALNSLKANPNADLTFPLSNGFAVHQTRDLADLSSKLEYLERDSIIAHDLYQIPPLAAITPSELFGFDAITPPKDDSRILRLASADPNVDIIVCILKVGTHTSLGWATSHRGLEAGCIKSLEEAAAAFRFHQIERFSTWKRKVQEIPHSTLNSETARQICLRFQITPADLQMALVLDSPGLPERISLFSRAPLVSKSQFFSPTPQERVLPPLSLRTEPLEDAMLGKLFLARTISEFGFEPRWPFLCPARTQKVHEVRFSSLRMKLTNNAHEPCIVY